MGVLTALPYGTDGGQSTLTPVSSAPNMFSGLLGRKVNRTRIVALAEYPRPGDADQTDFFIAERRPGVAFTPYRMDGAPTITVPAESVEEWSVENWTNEVHAFHIHQVHFRVLSVNGQSVTDPPLLDTVTVRGRDRGRSRRGAGCHKGLPRGSGPGADQALLPRISSRGYSISLPSGRSRGQWHDGGREGCTAAAYGGGEHPRVAVGRRCLWSDAGGLLYPIYDVPGGSSNLAKGFSWCVIRAQYS